MREFVAACTGSDAKTPAEALKEAKETEKKSKATPEQLLRLRQFGNSLLDLFSDMGFECSKSKIAESMKEMPAAREIPLVKMLIEGKQTKDTEAMMEIQQNVMRISGVCYVLASIAEHLDQMGKVLFTNSLAHAFNKNGDMSGFEINALSAGSPEMMAVIEGFVTERLKVMRFKKI